jgi:hypothetical protein
MPSNKQQTARDHLHELATFLRGSPAGLSTAATHYLADAIDDHLNAGVPLDQALGLRPGRGQRTFQTITVLGQRDALLRDIAARFFPGQTIEAQSHGIADAWSRYDANAWQRERGLEHCPPHRAGRLEGELFKLQKLRPRPLRWRQIFAILVAKSPPVFPANCPTYCPPDNGAEIP